MSFYQIDSRQLRTKKEELAGLNSRFLHQKDELVAKEAALRSMWEGTANENFHSQFMRFSGQMDSFAEVIGRYLSVIETIVQRYESAEQKNTGRVI